MRIELPVRLQIDVGLHRADRDNEADLRADPMTPNSKAPTRSPEPLSGLICSKK